MSFQSVCVWCRLAGKLVYGKIREALGVKRAVISGGGSLQPHLDDFFEVIGLTVLNGWGLSVRIDTQARTFARVRARTHTHSNDMLRPDEMP